MNNISSIIPILYPIISGICTLVLSLFGMFSPFLYTEKEFIKETDWHISLLRGIRIDKLKGFMSNVLNVKISKDSKNIEKNELCYINDIYECFNDDLEECLNIEYNLKKNLNFYQTITSMFMYILWLSVAIIILSLICNYFKNLKCYLNFLFILSIILIFLELINIILLRKLCVKNQAIFQNKVFKGKKNDI